MDNNLRPGTWVLFAALASGANMAVAQAALDQTNTSSSPPSPLGCIDVGALTTRTTPVEMYAAVRKCIGDRQLSRAARLFAVAGVYGRFDTLRVADESAHQVIPALRHLLFSQLDETSTKEFQASAKSYSPGGSDHDDLCVQIRTLGPPTYDPTYMLSHGLSAITGNGGGVTPGFDAATAWQFSLSNYLNCPPQAPGV
jgi:hypothetical protein